MSVLIKLRRGLASEWTSQNIVLASGEPGYELDTGRLKIGNGSTAWNSLQYASVIPTGLLAGSGININLGTNGSTATISVSGLNSSYISDFNEAVDDRIGSGLFVAGTGIDLSYNDSGNSFSVSVTGLISNPTNNRILTSRDSTTTGIDAETNLTFDGSLLNISGNLVAYTGEFSVIQLDTDNGPVSTQGQIAWNDTEGTVDIALTNTAVINVGEHSMYRARNTTGDILYKGQAVYASGVHANGIIMPNLYTADGSIREIRFMGLVYDNINNNNNGYVIFFGHINNIDTRGNVASNIAVGDETWADGDVLYVHPTVAGKLTKNEPKHSIAAAIILDAASNGKLFVRPTSYGHLDDNHDVSVSGATNGQFLQYNSATDYWVPSSSGNFSILQVSGVNVSVSGHTHTVSQITDFNSSVSGLLPTISNSGDNRILTSTGSSVGINAESNLTFNGTILSVIGILDADNIRIDGNTISSTNANGNIIIQPSGIGALQRDNGGNSRGNYAIDWQTERSSNDQVAAGSNSVIGGGRNNSSSGYISTVAGGAYNTSSSKYSSVGGGLSNISSGFASTIAGGRSNEANQSNSTVAGGYKNTASGSYSTIGGGDTNTSSGYISTVAGGKYNTSSSKYSTVGGGYKNNNSGFGSTIAGGRNNSSSGSDSAILGGTSNTDNGKNNVFILGSNITATQNDTTYIQNLIASNNVSLSGTLTAVSGSFTSLNVNGTGVSVSGHTHTASNITDFNEAVDDRIGSGLFVAGTGINLNYNDAGNSFSVSVSGLINNPTNNRILTSRDNSTTGIEAESNLTFDGSTLAVSGDISTSGIIEFNNGFSPRIFAVSEYLHIGNGTQDPVYISSFDGNASFANGGFSINSDGSFNASSGNFTVDVSGSGYFATDVSISGLVSCNALSIKDAPRTLYFTGGDWASTSSWYLDQDLTISTSIIPTSIDTVIIDGSNSLTSCSNDNPTCDKLILRDSAIISATVTLILNTLELYDSSSITSINDIGTAAGGITCEVVLHDSSILSASSCYIYGNLNLYDEASALTSSVTIFGDVNINSTRNANADILSNATIRGNANIVTYNTPTYDAIDSCIIYGLCTLDTSRANNCEFYGGVISTSSVLTDCDFYGHCEIQNSSDIAGTSTIYDTLILSTSSYASSGYVDIKDGARLEVIELAYIQSASISLIGRSLLILNGSSSGGTTTIYDLGGQGLIEIYNDFGSNGIGSSSAVTCNILKVYKNTVITSSTNITTNKIQFFNTSYYSSSSSNPNIVEFYDRSYLDGSITPVEFCKFFDESYTSNTGSITASNPVYSEFNGSSYNDGTVSCLAIFNGKSKNRGTVGNAIFRDNSENENSTTATNAAFFDYSTNNGSPTYAVSIKPSGTTLIINDIPVSVSGHTHTIADITDFNSSVSGLLPTISNSGDNRILTSTGSSTGIDAESNATFDGTNFNITGILNVDNIRIDGNTISSTNSNGSIIIQPTGTGAIQSDSGGNSRGQYALDLQRNRSTNTQVAGADYSVILNGSNNQINSAGFGLGFYSVIGGYNNTCSASSAFVMGKDNTVSGYGAGIVIGGGHTVIGGGNAVFGGSEAFPLYGGHTVSAYYSLIAGYNNDISSYANGSAAIGIGINISAAGSFGFGNSITITGQSSIAIGHTHLASGSFSTIIGGANNTASANYSICAGLYSKTTKYGELCHSAGRFTSNGDAQHSILIARTQTLSGNFTVTIASPAVFTKNNHNLKVGDTITLSTTGSLPTGLNTTTTYYVISAGLSANNFRVSTSAGGGAVNTSGTQSGTHSLTVTSSTLSLNGAITTTTPQLLTLPAETTWTFTVNLSAHNDTNNDGGWWIIRGGIRRNNSNTTTLIGSIIIESGTDSNLSTATVAVTADDTNEALNISVGGVAQKDIRWVAVVDISQVSYGSP